MVTEEAVVLRATAASVHRSYRRRARRTRRSGSARPRLRLWKSGGRASAQRILDVPAMAFQVAD
jgi:hypothetical protein